MPRPEARLAAGKGAAPELLAQGSSVEALLFPNFRLAALGGSCLGLSTEEYVNEVCI